MKHTLKGLLIGLTLTGCALIQAQPENFSPLVQNAWMQLPQSKNSCAEFDYFPRGGMRIFYCHAKNQLNYAQLQRLLDRKAFNKGPHGQDQLNLESKYDFGHYNPDFVRAAAQALIPQKESQVALTQAVYDRYVQPLARIFWHTHRKWQQHPQELKKEVQSYQAKIASKTLDSYDYERFFYFMNPHFFRHAGNEAYLSKNGFDGGYSGNVVKTAAAFWVRRQIDGSAQAFSESLETLLKTYDPAFLSTEK